MSKAMKSTSTTTFLLLMAAPLLLLILLPLAQASLKPNTKTVVVTNNHTNYLSVRCFSFNDDYTVNHLPSWGRYEFKVTKRVVYPSSTMFNCSTNMGTFVAYRYDYECTGDEYEKCDWRFDEDGAYRWEPKLNVWVGVDYAPNYESLNRGGVIQGYFAN